MLIPQHTAPGLSRGRHHARRRFHSFAETKTPILVPEGFALRIVARSGYLSGSNSDSLWHQAPDGGACFDSGDGGWICLSNPEAAEGGVGSKRHSHSQPDHPMQQRAVP